ncbi:MULTISPECIES: uracil-DNA glycosylase [Caldimonas]|uniref:uracil-DNA glycosylase n=1 Tax=Caldimonas TaxID=196013 RepID=UPI00037DB2E0|nr:uracil-DNA glycosylase [Caldimonas manganoxidans]
MSAQPPQPCFLAAEGPVDNRLREPLEACFERVGDDWRAVTEPFRVSPQGRALIDFVDGRVRQGAIVYPAQVFRALQAGGPQDVKVLILGQDPYHGAGQAQGLAFSVPAGQRLPPSLLNIYREVQADTGRVPPASGDLGRWAAQGVLLLNTVLTVEDGRPGSHAGCGWEVLTDALITQVSRCSPACVFLLWGASAQAKRPLIDATRHAILACNHPSPLSARRPPAPFVGCRHFSQANAWLASRGRSAILW